MTDQRSDVELVTEALQAVKQFKSQRKAAAFLGISRRTLRDRIAKSEVIKPLYDGRVNAFKRRKFDVPRGKAVNRYILTSAQNNTLVHEPFMDNLEAFAKAVNADIMVATYTYNHNAYGELATKQGTNKKQKKLWYDPRVVKYISDESIELAPGLVWCGELNISPTATNPLSGLDTYTRRASGIVPAAKLAMQSVASAKSDPTKFNYTTGTVTLRNYIQKKAGQKAEFHHAYCALIVEVNSAGDWWVRQLQADPDGSFYDLTTFVRDGVVTDGHEVEGITWGDIHGEAVDPIVAEVCWGEDGMLDTLRPRFQFAHDLLDFGRRNHHDRRDCHIQFEKFIEGTEEVEGEVQITANLVTDVIWRDWCETIVVDSNHDNAFKRWLREADYREDHVNALYFLYCQHKVYLEIKERNNNFHLVEWALREKGVPEDVRFLRQDEPFVICPDAGGGIECGMHGDLGLNGARGSPNSLKKVGRKANTGHTHSAGIYDGLWVAGLTALMDQGYNVGPGSWSHSNVITHKNGKRQMITIWKGKWRA